MPSIANGASATGTLGYADSVSVDAGGGFARFECPLGTIVSEFRGARTFGPYSSATYKITSLQGAIYYEVADGARSASVVADASTGALLQNGVEAINQGNAADGQVVCDWSSALGTLTGTTLPTGASVALDTDGSCKVTLGSGTGALFIDYVFSTAITLAQLVSLQIPVKYNSNTPSFSGSNRLEIELSDTVNPAAAVRRWRFQTGLDAGRLRSGYWHTLSAAPGAASEGWTFAGSSAPTSTTDMDAQTIARVRLVLTVAASSDGQTVNIGTLRANGRRKPVLTQTLHGNYDSQHKFILPMLEAQGMRATLAISVSTIGSGGRMTAAQLDRAYAAGHEIVLRCYNDSIFGNGYSDAANFPTQASITADINAGWDYMRQRGWTRGIGYLNHGGSVHPFAATNTPARQAIVSAAMIDAGVKASSSGDHNAAGVLNRCQSVARPTNVDALDVLGALQWASTNASADLIAVATRAKARGEWGVITGHESVVSGAAGLQILNSDYFTAVQSWGDDVRSGRMLFLPFGEACRYYGLTT